MALICTAPWVQEKDVPIEGSAGTVQEAPQESPAPETSEIVADVKVYLELRNGAKIEVTEENFPEEGVPVVIPYPTGITYEKAKTLNFSIIIWLP